MGALLLPFQGWDEHCIPIKNNTHPFESIQHGEIIFCRFRGENAPGFSYKTGYGSTNSCFKHSLMPKRPDFGSNALCEGKAKNNQAAQN